MKYIKLFENFIFDILENKKESRYSQEVLDTYRKKWEDGEEIPFGIESTLKAQGMIPRVDGIYKVSDDYKTPERLAAMKVYATKNKKKYQIDETD